MKLNHATRLSTLALALSLSTACSAQGMRPKASEPAQSTETGSQLPAVPQDLFVRHDTLKPAYFEPGKSQLDSKSQEELKSNVDWLKHNLPLQIVLAGYSDGRGTPEQNLAVGQRRAA